ncbi:MAG: hypothetical protein Q9164_000445 [Protoblastenia rupestris]
MSYLVAALTVLYYLTYPIFYVLHIIISILQVIIAPILHLGHYFVYACWYPFHVLGKFETLYVFFGVAIFVGVLTGTSLHFVSSFTISILRLEAQPEEDERGRTLAKYRAEKLVGGNRTTPENDSALMNGLKDWRWAKEERGRPTKGLIPNTILEEEDSSEGSF